MIGTHKPQYDMYKQALSEMLDPSHPILHLAKVIHWQALEAEFRPLYSEKGRPSKSLRMMLGLLIIKYLHH